MRRRWARPSGSSRRTTSTTRAIARSLPRSSQLNQNGEPVDPVSVAVELDRQGLLAESGGPAFVEELLDVGSSPANLHFHARAVAERGRLRKLIDVSHSVARDAFDGTFPADELLDSAQQQLFELAQKAAHRNYVDLKSLAGETFQTIQEAAQSKDEFTGVPTRLHQARSHDRRHAAQRPDHHCGSSGDG